MQILTKITAMPLEQRNLKCIMSLSVPLFNDIGNERAIYLLPSDTSRQASINETQSETLDSRLQFYSMSHKKGITYGTRTALCLTFWKLVSQTDKKCHKKIERRRY